MKLSVVIPAFNESESLPNTITQVYKKLADERIEHEILVVNDNSTDNTIQILESLMCDIPSLRHITNFGPNGFGYAIRTGIDNFDGDIIAFMMADLSDSPDDLVLFYQTILQENVDAIFGSRFIKGGGTIDYPWLKRIINRLANFIIRIAFRIKYNDVTNAFKMYKKETIVGLKPFLSPHFNLTIELPLKVIIRGYSYSIVPNKWSNRKYGTSKLHIREMGSRYFFILLYCLIEKYFAKGDFKKKWE